MPPKLDMNVEIFISCRKLKNLDTFSKSDPVVQVFVWDNRKKSWSKIGQTEQIKDTLNPDFKKSFTLNYSFEKLQKLRFVVLDVDVTTLEEIGYCETTMGNVMGAKNQTLVTDLKYDQKAGKRGQIMVRAEG